MSRLRPVPARKLIKVLTDQGWVVISQKGSHRKLRSGTGKTLVVPIHPGKVIKASLLRRILRDAELSVDDFLKLL